MSSVSYDEIYNSKSKPHSGVLETDGVLSLVVNVSLRASSIRSMVEHSFTCTERAVSLQQIHLHRAVTIDELAQRSAQRSRSMVCGENARDVRKANVLFVPWKVPVRPPKFSSIA